MPSSEKEEDVIIQEEVRITEDFCIAIQKWRNILHTATATTGKEVTEFKSTGKVVTEFKSIGICIKEVKLRAELGMKTI